MTMAADSSLEMTLENGSSTETAHEKRQSSDCLSIIISIGPGRIRRYSDKYGNCWIKTRTKHNILLKLAWIAVSMSLR